MIKKDRVIMLSVFLGLLFAYVIFKFNLTPGNENSQLITKNDNSEIQLLKNKILSLAATNKNTNYLLQQTRETQEIILTKLNTLLDDKIINNVVEKLKPDRNEENEELVENSSINAVPKNFPGSNEMNTGNMQLESQLHDQQIEDKFLSEPVDVEWNDKVNQKLEQLLNDKYLFGSDITLKECKTSICRIEITHDNVEAIKMFEQKYEKSFEWPGASESFSVSDGNGKIKTILHLMR